MESAPPMPSRNYSLLPGDKTYQELLFPFILPYMLYVGLEALFGDLLSPVWVQATKAAIVTGALLYFRGNYRLGPFRPRNLMTAAVAGPIATALWVVPLHVLGGGGATAEYSTAYIALRIFNSVVLVALFEELFCRAYLMEFLHRADQLRKTRGFLDGLSVALHEKPHPLANPPFSWTAVLGATAVFVLGHGPQEYLSAILWFSFTNVLYGWLRYFWICVLIHALSNALIAYLVLAKGMHFLW